MRLRSLNQIPQLGIAVAACTALLLIASTSSGRAQAPATPAAAQPSPQERIAAIKQSIADNQKALAAYSWIESTTVSVKGEVKKQEQKNCYYGADGKVQKLAIPGGAPAAAPQQQARGRGRLRAAIVENKVDEMKEYAEKVAALIQQYVPPDGAMLQAAQAAGNVAVQPQSPAALTATVKSYLKAGDSLVLQFDPTAKAIKTYSVNSYVDSPKDDVVTLAVTFAKLDDGTNYVQQAVLDMKAKQITATIANSGYKKGR